MVLVQLNPFVLCGYYLGQPSLFLPHSLPRVACRSKRCSCRGVGGQSWLPRLEREARVGLPRGHGAEVIGHAPARLITRCPPRRLFERKSAPRACEESKRRRSTMIDVVLLLLLLLLLL